MNTPEHFFMLQNNITTQDNRINTSNSATPSASESNSKWMAVPGKRPWSSIQRWLWENTSSEKSVSQSYVLNQETFYFLRQVCFAISAVTWTMSQVDSCNAILTNFQYLTEWGLDLTVLYFALTLRIMKNHKFAEKYWKLAHGIFEVCYSVQFIITAMYWGAIYPTITREKNAYYLLLTTLEHGGMFLLLIIDKIVNQIKFYKRHLIYLAAFMIVYLTVNLTVTLCFSPVYSIIDWNTRESHIFTLVALLGTLLHFCSARIIYDLFKKHKVERAVKIADDYFFTPHPLTFNHFNKYLNNRYVWWALLISVILVISSSQVPSSL